MSCDFSGTLLHAYLDGELDAMRAADFERHLETCRECTATLGAAESLRSSLQHAQLYETAPAGLRKKIRAELKVSAGKASGSSVAAWRWLAVAAAILLVTGVAWFALPHFLATSMQSSVTSTEIVDAHIRSLQAGHLTDVISTDQHTVKPWFNGRVDFSPPVNDFAADGFRLIGGRLDYLDGRPVAALVYQRRKHIINVFVWPAPDGSDSAVQSTAHDGYNLLHWRRGGMNYWMVSDLNAQEMNAFARLLRGERASTAAPS